MCADVASTLDAHFGDKQGLENQHVNSGCALFVAEPVAPTLPSRSSAGGGMGTDLDCDGGLVAHPITFDATQITSAANYSRPKAGDPCHPLRALGHVPAIAFSCKDSGADASPEVAPTMRAMGHDGSHANAGGQLAVAMGHTGGPPLWTVRRLSVTECHRLQGFPDGWCNVPWRGKAFAPDGPQYKALGNSKAVNVVRWVGRRIEMVERVLRQPRAA